MEMIIAFSPLNEKAHSPGVGWPCDDTFFVQTNALYRLEAKLQNR